MLIWSTSRSFVTVYLKNNFIWWHHLMTYFLHHLKASLNAKCHKPSPNWSHTYLPISPPHTFSSQKDTHLHTDTTCSYTQSQVWARAHFIDFICPWSSVSYKWQIMSFFPFDMKNKFWVITSSLTYESIK